MERGIKEVCEEALNKIEEVELYSLNVPFPDLKGYFIEILNILKEREDDGK